MDDDLRASLWSILHVCFWEQAKSEYGETIQESSPVRGSSVGNLAVGLWFHHFKRPVDTIPTYWKGFLGFLRDHFFKAEWYEAYDFIEYMATEGADVEKKTFTDFCNKCLERENAAYRFVKGQLTEITSEVEIQAVESAIGAGTAHAGVTRHLETALALMSDRKTPDYRNSIKESISAVESLAKHIAKDPSGTLGTVLKELERSKALHPALKSAFSSLYGYTNDAHGIRHALMDEPTLTKADARFMLVCCSSFVNYVLESTANKQGGADF
jgi:hypothetical protein